MKNAIFDMDEVRRTTGSLILSFCFHIIYKNRTSFYIDIMIIIMYFIFIVRLQFQEVTGEKL
jgi:hypothetical protein